MRPPAFAGGRLKTAVDGVVTLAGFNEAAGFRRRKDSGWSKYPARMLELQ